MKNTNSLFAVRTFSVIAFIMMITVNALANILPINGQNTGQISDLYPNLFTPAALTFSIWSVIYLFLLMYTIYQTGFIFRKSPHLHKTIEDIGGLYILTCLANAAWILCWHYNLMLLSVVVMLILLMSLILIYLKIRASLKSGMTRPEKWFLSVPFSLYLGWISVASIANITAYLVKIKWDGWGIQPQIWTIAAMSVAALITLIFLSKFRDIAYSLVTFWALLGILIKHIGFFKMEYTGIIVTAVLTMAVLLIGMYMAAFRTRKRTGRKTAVRKKRKK